MSDTTKTERKYILTNELKVGDKVVIVNDGVETSFEVTGSPIFQTTNVYSVEIAGLGLGRYDRYKTWTVDRAVDTELPVGSIITTDGGERLYIRQNADSDGWRSRRTSDLTGKSARTGRDNATIQAWVPRGTWGAKVVFDPRTLGK